MAAKTSDPIDILLEMGIDLDNLSEEEDYLSALKEAIATIEFKTGGKGDERSAALREEVIKVRKSRKAADSKFKEKKTTIKPENLFQRRLAPKQNTLPSVGALVPYQAPDEEEGAKRKRSLRKKTSDPLKDILKSVNSILATLKNQNKLTKKQAERDRKDAEKAKRSAQEDDLEKAPLKKFFDGAKKLAKPAISFFESIMKFIVNVLIGRLLVKILGWMGDPKNSKKMTAIMDFFKVTWPAFLAAFLAFQFGLGGFITGLLGLIGGFIPKLLGLIPKMLAGLGKLATGNPLLVAAAAGAALFAMGKIVPEVAPQTVETETDKKVDENVKKKGGEQTATDLAEEQAAKQGERNAFQNFFFGTVMGEDAEYEKQTERAKTGKEPEYGKKFNKGGVVPGSGNGDTVPAMLTPGEFVMSKGAVQQYGLDTMKSMNAAGGGNNIPMVSGGVTYAEGGGEVKNNDESNDRPKGDHTHNSSDILGLNKIGSMISGFAKTPIGNVLLPGVGPALSIAETLMGRGKPKAREQRQQETDRILTTTDVLPDGTIRTQGSGTLVAGEVYDPNNPTEMQKAALALSGQMGNPAPAASKPVSAKPKTPAAPAPTTTEQPKEKGRGLLSMYAGYLDFMTGNIFDIDGMGRPSSMSASPEKEEKEGEKSGSGGSLKELTGQDFRDLAYIVSGEAQRGTDDEYGVAAAVLNRVADPAWPNTIKAVGSQDGQFEAVYTGKAYDDPALAQKLASPEGQAKIVEALNMLKGRTDFKGTSQYGNMGQGDVKFSDRGNFYHYKEQVGPTDPPPSPIPTYYQKFIGTGGPAVTLNGTKSSSSGITASPGPGGGPGGPGGGDAKTPAAQMRSAGPSKPLPPPSRGERLSDIYARQEARAGRGPSSGSSASAEGANPGALNTPNSNDLPPIDANAMISMEKIKVLGLTVV